MAIKYEMDELKILKELLKQAIIDSDVIEYIQKIFPVYLKTMKEIKRIEEINIPF